MNKSEREAKRDVKTSKEKENKQEKHKKKKKKSTICMGGKTGRKMHSNSHPHSEKFLANNKKDAINQIQ